MQIWGKEMDKTELDLTHVILSSSINETDLTITFNFELDILLLIGVAMVSLQQPWLLMILIIMVVASTREDLYTVNIRVTCHISI